VLKFNNNARATALVKRGRRDGWRVPCSADGRGVQPPVRWPLSDAARALQFLRGEAHDLDNLYAADGSFNSGCLCEKTRIIGLHRYRGPIKAHWRSRTTCARPKSVSSDRVSCPSMV